MSGAYDSGRYALAECDRCGVTCRYKSLRPLTKNKIRTNILVCKSCWEPDHPQLYINTVDKGDPQALKNPRPEKNLDQQRAIVGNPVFDAVMAGPYPWRQ